MTGGGDAAELVVPPSTPQCKQRPPAGLRAAGRPGSDLEIMPELFDGCFIDLQAQQP